MTDTQHKQKKAGHIMDHEPFKPQGPKKPITREAIISIIVGTEHKAKFKAFCKRHKMAQTKMLKQMIDYCIQNSEEEEQ